MKLSLLVIGKTTDRHVQTLIDDYASRLSHYVPFSLDVIPELRNTKALSEEQQKSTDLQASLDDVSQQLEESKQEAKLLDEETLI